MLSLRARQVDQLQSSLDDAYVRRLAEYFRGCARALIERIPPSELQPRIRVAVASARRYGYPSDRATCQYVAISLAAGAGFDEDPTIVKFFRARGEPFDQKVEILSKKVLDRSGHLPREAQRGD